MSRQAQNSQVMKSKCYADDTKNVVVGVVDEFTDKPIFLQQKGTLLELVDPDLGSEFSKEEALRMIKVALLCINPSSALRPIMSTVVSMLEGQTVVHELKMDPSIYANDLRVGSLKDQCQTLRSSSSESQSLIQSSNATWMGSSSTSAQDLYSINPDSQ
ncbi:putative lrr receptor-like serine/threonine-protein kinase [Fagus crenata]